MAGEAAEDRRGREGADVKPVDQLTPTPLRYTRARTVVGDLQADITASVARLRAELQPQDDTQTDLDLCTVEMFVAIALRVMAKSNPSKVRGEAMNVEIQARLDGKPEAQRPPLGQAA